ncbi:AsmA family protein [Pseudodesulfovibrio cashew]|uniref:AsmA family protein n=1 Tax=Pseudodesulfovibrio cashew TaxID=2678688 RepID=A0A6I6JG80_9BACT|nr:AsmA family protein [Pseudodesulfovibrio cashew]QGY39057.1 AsmA family protein [Pseudodesulfovibrio cashew]
MSKPIKIILAVAGALAGLFLVAVVILVTTVDPNAYKAEISKAVKEQTGRDLVFEGDIHFNFLPWLGLEVGPVALGNRQGFSPAEMIRINRAEASIRVLPLLTGDVAVGVVVLDGLTVNLAVNKKGINNWDDLSKGEKTAAAEPESQGKEQAEGGSLGSLSVLGVEITGANITYDDQKAGKKTAVNNLNLIIGEVGDKLPTPIVLTFDLKLDDPKIETRPKLTGTFTSDAEAGTARLTDLALTFLNARLTGDFFARAKDDKVDYSAELKLDEMSPKELLSKLGMDMVTADTAALTKASADIKLNGTPDAVSLESMAVVLDDTNITATGSVANFAKPAVRLELNVDDIDADRYLPPASDKKQDGTKTASTETASSQAEEPDLSALKDQDLRAKLTVGKLKAMNLRVSDILVEISAKNGIVQVNPFQANLYDGSLKGHSTLDVRVTPAPWKESADLKDVQAGPLLKDLTGKDHILGTTVAKYDVTGFGLTPDNIKKSLTGTASFAFTDGAINGVNVAKMLRDAWARIKGKAVSADEPARTDFAELLGSARMDKGHITNDDLLMKSPLLRVTGKGWADLPKNTVDYLTTVTVVGTLKGQEGESIEDLKGLPVPVYAKGSLDSPEIGLDAKALAEALFKGKFKEGTKNLEEKLKKDILGGSKSGTQSGDTQETKKPGSVLKGLF